MYSESSSLTNPLVERQLEQSIVISFRLVTFFDVYINGAATAIVAISNKMRLPMLRFPFRQSVDFRVAA